MIDALINGIFGSMAADAQGDAAESAARMQYDAAMAGVNEQRRQFDNISGLLRPYVDAGTGGLSGMQDLLGLNGSSNEQAQIDAILRGPTFDALAAQGEKAILQNASATGGLRGGRIQDVLATYRPNRLQALIDQRYQQFGGLASLGQNSAAMTGNAGMQTGTNISNLLGNAGAAQAQGAIGSANAYGNQLRAIGQIFKGIGGGNGIASGIGGLFNAGSGGSWGSAANNYSQGYFDANGYYGA